jgi:hypothetical protein
MLRKFHSDWAVIDLLADFILTHTNGDVFETGCGRTSLILNQYVVDHNRTHHVCDINWKKIHRMNERLKNVNSYLGKSLDFIKTIPDISIAIAFIDGEHLYETVMEEFNFAFERLSKNGVIFFHDTYPPRESWVVDKNKFCGNVYKVRQELEKRNDLQIFTWEYGAGNCGLSMVSKKEKNRPFYKR